jgi:hypothetical protein
MDVIGRTLEEYRRLLKLMQEGDEDHRIPPLDSPLAINTLAWAIAVLEHEAARKDEDDNEG